VIIDIEASSLDPVRSYPIEIAWSIGGGRVKSFLVNLKSVLDDMDWSEASEGVHGIGLEECLESGYEPIHIVNEFLGDLGDAPPYSDGPAYDYHWLRQLFKMAGKEVPFGQIIPAADLFAKALRNNGFAPKNAIEVANAIIEDDVGAMRAHRAADDVQALMIGLEIAQKMRPEAKIRVEDYSHKGSEKVRQEDALDSGPGF
jgi:hypothetical protein